MTQKKFRFNITDLFIILVLLAAVAVLVYVFVISDNTELPGEKHTIEYVVVVTPVNEIFSDAIKEGDRVTLAKERDSVLGTVTLPPQIEQNVSVVYDEVSGNEVYPEREGIVDMYVTFTAEASEHDWGYAIGESETIILVNDSVNLLIGDMQCAAECIEMRVLD